MSWRLEENCSRSNSSEKLLTKANVKKLSKESIIVILIIAILSEITQKMGKPPPNDYSEYDTKQSDGEVPVMLELWGMRCTPSLP